jgi:hypothetical protein
LEIWSGRSNSHSWQVLRQIMDVVRVAGDHNDMTEGSARCHNASICESLAALRRTVQQGAHEKAHRLVNGLDLNRACADSHSESVVDLRNAPQTSGGLGNGYGGATHASTPFSRCSQQRS